MNKAKIIWISIFFSIIMLVSGCGPSSEEIATMTASAWTPTPSPTYTPTPTPSPTPIPYDLTVSIKDENGNPIDKASIEFPDSGDDEPIITDDSGIASWKNLPGDGVSFLVKAQGYSDFEESTTIDRGLNEIAIVMERDLLQILPSEACQPGQELLYLEDFEDGEAQGWDNIARPLWTFEEIEGRGTILAAYPSSEIAYTVLEDEVFHNAVWHLDIRRNPNIDLILLRFIDNPPEEESYNTVFAESGSELWIHKEGSDGSDWPDRSITRPDGETWEKFTFSVFEGTIDLWINGKLMIGVNDPSPYEYGSLSIEMSQSDEPVAFDNFVVCSLTEPYVPSEEVEE